MLTNSVTISMYERTLCCTPKSHTVMYVKFISITLGGNVFKSKTLWRKKNEQCNLEQFFVLFCFVLACLTLFKAMVSVGNYHTA